MDSKVELYELLGDEEENDDDDIVEEIEDVDVFLLHLFGFLSQLTRLCHIPLNPSSPTSKVSLSPDCQTVESSVHGGGGGRPAVLRRSLVTTHKYTNM